MAGFENNKPAEKKTALVRGARATRGLGEPINAAAAATTAAHESGREQTARPPRADQRERERETFRVLEAPSSQRGAKVERERKKAAEQAKKKKREEALTPRSRVIRADNSGGGLGEAVVVAPAAAAAEPAPAPRAGQLLGHAEAGQLDHRVPTWPTLRDAGLAVDNPPPAAGDSGARESVAVTSGILQPSASVHYAAPNGSVLDDAQEPIPRSYYDQLPPGFSEEQAEELWRKKGRPFCPRCHLRHPPPHDPELFEVNKKRRNARKKERKREKRAEERELPPPPPPPPPLPPSLPPRQSAAPRSRNRPRCGRCGNWHMGACRAVFCSACGQYHERQADGRCPQRNAERYQNGLRRFFADALDNSPAFREEVINRFPNIITLAHPAQLTLPSP
ncbi:hypothetical protein DIS24_g785 [Lasiodiplodia hormozganensis]|uniref:Uncharacterized protein n=1 Tax=Lasiodiplodia hormozganensis TaxID=869390 RepID=A0AA39Z4N3_9PEZI|nr:hypothetical protein DIS24_g785 [Lasiodiplodia hormozganensis]